MAVLENGKLFEFHFFLVKLFKSGKTNNDIVVACSIRNVRLCLFKH